VTGAAGSGGAIGAAGSGGAAGLGGAAGQAGGGGHAGGTAGGGAGGGAAGAGGGAAGAGGGIAGAGGGVAGAGGIAGSGVAGGAGGMAGQAGASPPPAHSLSLLAGGLGGPGNVDGVGANARFWGGAGMALDGAGNLFVADASNNEIRKIVVATGAVTTLAGQAVTGSFADGTGAAARFNDPMGVALDGAGNLYVADHSNWVIRKIVIATGVVTTLAGSPTGRGTVDGKGAATEFVGPAGITYDGTSGLFVTDTMESDGGFQTKIRRIEIATGVVSTIATLPGTYYGVPNNIAYDSTGNLYVAYFDAVEQVNLATAAVTTLAGTLGQNGLVDGTGAAARFGFFPGGLFDDGAGNLYVSDSDNNHLRKVVIATGAVTTLPDETASLVRPSALVADGTGAFFVAIDDHTIRKFVPATGAVTTLAGAGSQSGSADGTGAAARFSDPYAIASDGAGNLFVADTYNGTIRKVVVATGAVTTLAGTAGQLGSQDGVGAAATFSQPIGIVSDGAGSLYVTDGSIRKIDVATRTVTTLSAGPPRTNGYPGPSGITFDGAGHLFFIDSQTAVYELVIANGNIRQIAGSAGVLGSVNGTGAAARFWVPEDLVSDGAGNLFVADTGNYVIRKIVVATRAVTTLAGRLGGGQGSTDGRGANARFSYPRGIAFDGTGNLYVADGNIVRKIVASNGTVSTVVGAPGSFGVALGPLPASLNDAYGVAVLPMGELAIVDYLESAVLIANF
jgi:hypothetical protein